MPRHRGTYNPEREEPYEVSRYQIGKFMSCKACFWMDRVKGINFTGMITFMLNSATDTLFKKDFDKRNILKNKKVLVSNFSSSDCTALDVNEDGSLNLLVDNFKKKVTSGEVSLKLKK